MKKTLALKKMITTENLIPYGLRDGHIISVEDLNEKTEYGKKCNCICPRCKAPLIAKIKNGQQGRRRKHFAHDGTANCNGAYESALHMLVKEVIDEGATIKLPPIVSTFAKNGYFVLDDAVFKKAQISDAIEITPDIGKTEIEKDLGNFRPDVVIESLGSKLIIEVLVSHAVDEEKKKQIIDYGISCIEIDFSFYRDTIIDKERIRKALEGNDPEVIIRWIYCKKQDKVDSFLKQHFSSIWILDSPKQELKSGDLISDLGNKHKISNRNIVNKCGLYSRSDIQEQHLHSLSVHLYNKMVHFGMSNTGDSNQMESKEDIVQPDELRVVWNREDLSYCLNCSLYNGVLSKLDSGESCFLICSKDDPEEKKEIEDSCKLIIEFAKKSIVPHSDKMCMKLIHAFVVYLDAGHFSEVKESEIVAVKILIDRLREKEELAEANRKKKALSKEQIENKQYEEWLQNRNNLFKIFEKEVEIKSIPDNVSFESWYKSIWIMLQSKVPNYYMRKYGSRYVRLIFRVFAKKNWQRITGKDPDGSVE